MYEWCARAMTLARTGVDRDTYLRALALLEQGARELPDDWRIPYTRRPDLHARPEDRRLRRSAASGTSAARGCSSRRSASRAPPPTPRPAPRSCAPSSASTSARSTASARCCWSRATTSRAQRAPRQARRAVEDADADEVAAEVLEARKRFDAAWRRDRPAIPASMYILLGPRRSRRLRSARPRHRRPRPRLRTRRSSGSIRRAVRPLLRQAVRVVLDRLLRRRRP